ncbi:hypothetical protein VTK26DRAFT_6334 [Humicola hyalothermophila]
MLSVQQVWCNKKQQAERGEPTGTERTAQFPLWDEQGCEHDPCCRSVACRESLITRRPDRLPSQRAERRRPTRQANVECIAARVLSASGTVECSHQHASSMTDSSHCVHCCSEKRLRGDRAACELRPPPQEVCPSSASRDVERGGKADRWSALESAVETGDPGKTGPRSPEVGD